MLFRQILHEEDSCTSYIVGCPTLGVAAVVDPQGDVDGYVRAAERHGLRIADVIDTHIHADHRSSARDLAKATEGRLHLGAGADVGFGFEPMRDGQEIKVGNRRIQVLHTPGHTPEHVSLLVDDWFVLTGDTLFVGDVGRVDLSLAEAQRSELEERARALYRSLQRLLTLDDHVEVYPGHYAGSTCGRGMDGKPMSTIGRERRFNEALSLREEDFVNFQLENLPPLPDNFEKIKRANIAPGTEARPA